MLHAKTVSIAALQYQADSRAALLTRRQLSGARTVAFGLALTSALRDLALNLAS
jgi:hypothetical protein